jgi:phospholipid transport system substrate-binding protein
MEPSSRSATLAALLLLLALFAPAAPAEQTPPGVDPDPTAVIDKLHTVLIGVMKEAEALGYRGRYERLEPALREVFDLPFMAEKSVGRHWKTASEAEREELVSTFTRFTIANYAGRFEGWSGQSFRTLGEQPSMRGTMLVRTRLDEPDDDGVALDYRLRKDGSGEWKIVDVYLNGTVSELALRRSEYSSLIQREGFGALLVKLDQRIDELATTPADQS